MQGVALLLSVFFKLIEFAKLCNHALPRGNDCVAFLLPEKDYCLEVLFSCYFIYLLLCAYHYFLKHKFGILPETERAACQGRVSGRQNASFKY